jgi:Tfp pilus assembly protein PilF
MGADATSDWSKPIAWIDQALVRLAEIEKEKPAAKEQIQQLRLTYLPTRGALLYRAGRFEESAKDLREGVSHPTQVKEFRDWAFLALAEHRLGRPGAATEAAAKARAAQAKSKPDSVWDKAEIELLSAQLDAALPPRGK